ncbi:glucose-6-phosphate isomerase [Arcobacter porcinus]|uniref:Glucose-6-phosphate isomerase n=1 Tax=Arcobacter porcinus TaxID=1935204 RepID=A0A5C2HH97_9BACT|nr:glucose-6-phosphate isomerase [Arcobacter porcinus]OCL89394.1 Glucose-6-phosphate isomerase [Aliarcobacter thereius]QEP40462.1 phosphoglucose isomerase [Arcobacter porcinus]
MQNTLYYPKVSLKDEDIFNAIKQERDSIGYYSLAFCETQELKSKLDSLNFKQNKIAIIGIGGSTLGTYAIYNFLKYHKQNNQTLKKEILFFESTDPVNLNGTISQLDLEDTLFIIISKSGTTIETISIFKYLSSLINMNKDNLLVITENDSKLNSFAQTNNLITFEIPKNVGGRFSVLSNVGLVPLYLAGFDIDELLRGARYISTSFFEQNSLYDTILKKARTYYEYKDIYNINAVFSYSQLLEGFNKWYVQLWGESLGKIDINNANQGLTPIGLLGPVDQHSFLQLIVEGKRDKTVTFIKIKDFKDDTKISSISLNSLEELDYINNIDFKELINLQADATIASVKEYQKDIPIDIIEIEEISEFEIGKLLFYYELLTSVVGQFLRIDTYNQPGVEGGKIILKELLKTKK